jgi:hypothetical protein
VIIVPGKIINLAEFFKNPIVKNQINAGVWIFLHK